MWEPEVTEYQWHSATLTATGKITADDIKWPGSELDFLHSTWKVETTTSESEGYGWLTYDGMLLMFTSDQSSVMKPQAPSKLLLVWTPC